jgi:hypothetical protein
MRKTSNAPAGSGEGACHPGGDSPQLSTIGQHSKLAHRLERIAADDRRWFERHPRKRWRIRPPLPGEYPCGPQMAVRSFGPARMRFPVWGRIPLGLTDRGVELFMRAVLPPEHVRLLDEIEAIMLEAGA